MTKYRNPFEERCARDLGPDYLYEPFKLTYTIQSTYTPDFVDPVNKRIVEAKGLFDSQDRRKLLAVKAQHPDWEITLLFQNPNNRINPKSATTYAMWAEKHCFKWKAGPRK